MVPSFSRRTAERTAVSGDASYVPNGRSPTSSGLRAAGRSPQGSAAQRDCEPTRQAPAVLVRQSREERTTAGSLALMPGCQVCSRECAASRHASARRGDRQRSRAAGDPQGRGSAAALAPGRGARAGAARMRVLRIAAQQCSSAPPGAAGRMRASPCATPGWGQGGAAPARAAGDGAAVQQHVLKRHGQRGVVPVHDHAHAVAHQQDVDPGRVHLARAPSPHSAFSRS